MRNIKNLRRWAAGIGGAGKPAGMGIGGAMRTVGAVGVVLVFCLSAGCAELIEKDLTGKKTLLLAPSDGIASDTSVQNFSWQTLDGATKYELQVVMPRFDSIVLLVADTTVGGNFFSVTQLSPGGYQWRVRSLNSSSATPFSNAWNFTIQ